MKDEQAVELHKLLVSRSTAALGTLHDGAPYVSMVPFAMLLDGSAFVIHVSRLAAHTNDMLADNRVSLLVTGDEQSAPSPQALPRVTIQATARPVFPDSPDYPSAREIYLSRFPDAAPLFTLGDFALFLISPTEIRWVAGFAQARTLSPAAFSKALRDAQN